MQVYTLGDRGLGLGFRDSGDPGDIDPLSKVLAQESQKRVQKGSLLRVPQNPKPQTLNP